LQRELIQQVLWNFYFAKGLWFSSLGFTIKGLGLDSLSY
jgi:hypothetical protein